MSTVLQASSVDSGSGMFSELGHSPRQHFTLYLYAAVLRVLSHASLHFGSPRAAIDNLPFLAGYLDELASRGLEGTSFGDAIERWRVAMDEWEAGATEPLPLARLRAAAGLTHDALTLLAQIGLPDEDPRMFRVYETLQGGSGDGRPTLGLLAASWSIDDGVDARALAHRLLALGAAEPVPGEFGALRASPALWDAVRGAGTVEGIDWARHRPRETLPELDELVLAEHVRVQAAAAAAAVASGAAAGLIVRGLRHNGRSTIAAALARSLNKGVLQVEWTDDPRDPRWRSAATLACMLDAVLLTSAEPGPSETRELPAIQRGLAPLFVTIGTAGGLTGPVADRALTLTLPSPGRAEREELWSRTLGRAAHAPVDLRLTSGNIVRAGALVRATTPPGARASEAALRSAVRAFAGPGLESHARRVDGSRVWSDLAVSAETMTELTTLAARCRQRERLGGHAGRALADVGPGVRALLKGPSGSGKTLAAQVLASELGRDLYRVDLATVVDKYIGETEKNLERVFERAEELDVVLLLDEGDALLTQRTSVQSANDRYANLETNYLLQRVESYQGILLVTTNAGDRIDSAFQRRMDVVIDFALPDAPERWTIWELHLPERHEIDRGLLNTVVQRCPLSGAQIRNVVLHAALLAAERDARIGSGDLEVAIEREYRKQSSISPLRAPHRER